MSLKRIMNFISRKVQGLSVNGNLGKIYNILSFKKYMASKEKNMRKLGIVITGHLRYVSSDVYFDGHDYSLIHIGDDVTISREVMFLTHDYSLGGGMRACGLQIQEGREGTPHFEKPIIVGDECFIGARATLLPGTTIGYGCIIGACAVIKGNIPEYSIVIGNPAKVIGDVRTWVEKHSAEQKKE